MIMPLFEMIQSVNQPCEIKGDIFFETLDFDFRNPVPNTCSFASSILFFEEALINENITCIITSKEIFEIGSSKKLAKSNKGFILAESPKTFFYLLHNHLCALGFYTTAKFTTIIHPAAQISNLASIAPNNVRIGANTIVEEFVVIRENVSIGENTYIQSGVSIGNSCIQCIRMPEQNTILDIEHVGGVSIGSNVKIESNSVICRHIFNKNTIIGSHTKISGLSHITHGCQIGERVIITPNVVVNGSTIIEDDVYIGPNATISSALTIKKSARLTMGSVVTKNVGENEHLTGNFAIPHHLFMKDLKKITKKG